MCCVFSNQNVANWFNTWPLQGIVPESDQTPKYDPSSQAPDSLAANTSRAPYRAEMAPLLEKEPLPKVLSTDHAIQHHLSYE
jgi:hypothetical protein